MGLQDQPRPAAMAPTDPADRPPHHVVVVGAGFGGLFAARRLRGEPVAVTVVDRTNHHLFQPLLYQVATGILSEGEIAPALRDVLRRHRNTAVRRGQVTGVDLDARTVTVDQLGVPSVIPYDSLILATGASTSYFGHDEFAAWAPGMKSIDDALELRGRIFGAFEAAEVEPGDGERQAWLTFAVIGGGPTGVEMAGQLAELSARSLRRNFRRIDPSRARILLFEGAGSLLEAFGPELSALAEKELTRLGVEVHTGALVTAMDERGVVVRKDDGSTVRFEARTKVWAAGTSASPLGRLVAEASGTPLDRAGRVRVEPDCSLPGHPEVFVVGDLMAYDGVPGMAEGAIQSGRHAARQVLRHLEGRASEPFRYRDLGTMAMISRFEAVARFGPLRIGGAAGWLLWLVVHLTFLTGFKNRFTALVHWAISFVGRGRTERAVTEQQVVARQALIASAAQGQAGPPGSRGGI